VAFGTFIVGIFFLLRDQSKMLKIGILLITIIFGLFIIKTGKVFPNHSYYVIPFTPIMALIAAFALEKLPNKLHYAILGLICIESIANQQDDFFIKDSEKYKLGLEAIAAEHIPEGELVVINGGLSPQSMYFAHRKGWTLHHAVVMDRITVDSLHVNHGANYVILNKNGQTSTYQKQTKIFDGKDFVIYKIED
jgi:hypothetical protein